ncbi:hypothetical protein Tco_1098996 [Tanacetum coccineum]
MDLARDHLTKLSSVSNWAIRPRLIYFRPENQEQLRMLSDELRKYTSSMMKFHPFTYNHPFVEKKGSIGYVSKKFVNSLRLILKRSPNVARHNVGVQRSKPLLNDHEHCNDPFLLEFVEVLALTLDKPLVKPP